MWITLLWILLLMKLGLVCRDVKGWELREVAELKNEAVIREAKSFMLINQCNHFCEYQSKITRPIRLLMNRCVTVSLVSEFTRIPCKLNHSSGLFFPQWTHFLSQATIIVEKATIVAHELKDVLEKLKNWNNYIYQCKWLPLLSF